MPEVRRSRRHDERGNYIPQNTTSGGVLSGPGPYIARVVSVIDSTYMGTLQVELLKSASTGNQAETEGQLFNVKYLSPFYGATAVYHNGKNETYEDTQQSYGFWAVPPDPGTRVVVIFVESDPARGFWIGCVQDEYMNFMVPGAHPSTAANASQRKLPVGEYNKLTDVVRGNDPTKYRKPVNNRFTNTLVEQGLFSDETRGLTTSSARREVPSMVFGISTPGPVDKNTKPTEVGIRQAKGKYYASRLGGQSFVMDDGDDKLLRKGKAKNSPSEYANVEAGEQGGDIEVPHNELVRIRTRTGHQILLHNSEDLIYIGNSRGTSWIELTSNGKIDIYAKDSISIHTEEDLNFTADRDINFTAGQNINTIAGKEIRRSAGQSISQTSGTFISDNAGTRISRAATTAITDWAGGGGINLATQGAFQAASVQSMLLGSQAEVGIESCGSSFVKAGGCVNITAGESILETAAVDVGITASAGNTDITSGAEMHVKAGSSIYNSTGSNYNTEAVGIIAQDAAEIYLNSGVSGSADTAETAYAPPGVNPAGPKQPVIPDPTARVPMHEPWLEHENLNPLNYTPDKTRAGTVQTPTEPVLTPDTFAKSIGNSSGTTDSFNSATSTSGSASGLQTAPPSADGSSLGTSGINNTATEVSYPPSNSNSDVSTLTEAGNSLGRLLDFIASGEGGYESVNRGTIGNRIVGSDLNATRNGKPITQLTFREIFELQSISDPNNVNRIFAVGRYQIIPDTMRDIFPYIGFSLDDLYNEENQDLLGVLLIVGTEGYVKRRNLSNYIKGRSDDIQAAMLDFAKEWASLPDPRTGNSFYGSGNRSSHTVSEVSQALRDARIDYTGNNSTLV